MRVGVVAKKLGMSAMFDSKGNRVSVTLLQLGSCAVIGHKTKQKDGYVALQVGAFDASKNVSKSLKGVFKKASVQPKTKIIEFRVEEDSIVDVGSKISVTHYVLGQLVDIVGTTQGKGFAGVMKRHNFGGLRASHGVSVSHRSHGSTGQCQDPGKVFKGKKMAGHMGDTRVTVQNLEVLAIDQKLDVLVVKGAVPGSKGSYVVVKDAMKVALPSSAPYPMFKAIVENEVFVAEEQTDK
jgi:large subunit ribosomal protein L3